ncbi:hypothetical protein E3N88_25769 [Mikania micrantha]|uniref:Uncharacterized protein n=1 Tax=Mikania micrantha TaxID=192012 RepID=A0A5N6N794_9ASTR|nr:hypothetical protein E3N88_25769 [Mikania micrantha]
MIWTQKERKSGVYVNKHHETIVKGCCHKSWMTSQGPPESEMSWSPEKGKLSLLFFFVSVLIAQTHTQFVWVTTEQRRGVEELRSWLKEEAAPVFLSRVAEEQPERRRVGASEERGGCAMCVETCRRRGVLLLIRIRRTHNVLVCVTARTYGVM